jgi:hypothetical protein
MSETNVYPQPITHNHYHYNNTNDFSKLENDLETNNMRMLEAILIIFGSILFVQGVIIIYLFYQTKIHTCWKQKPNSKRKVFTDIEGEMNHEMAEIVSANSENSSENSSENLLNSTQTNPYVVPKTL